MIFESCRDFTPLRPACVRSVAAAILAATTLFACSRGDQPSVARERDSAAAKSPIGAAAPAPARSRAPDRLRPCDRALCAGATRFDWRGVTAFGLVSLVAEGRRDDAGAFLDWARDTGFTVVRTLTMLPNGGWLELSPEDGRRALPVVLEMAAARGLYVQAVALANTGERSGRYRTDAFMREQVREVGRACAAAPNGILEIANEPYHGSQADLDEPALMERLQREVPPDVPVTWGAASDDRSTAMAGGTFVVTHLARSGEWWTRVARARDLAWLSRETGKFVVDNEPIGAAEKPEPSRRDASPDAFFAQGAASRLADAGATFHCEDCLRARVPGPVQRACAEAFVAGRGLLPAEARPRMPADEPARLAEGATGAVLAAVDGRRAYALVLGPAADAGVTWGGGWQAATLVGKRNGVALWAAER